MIEVYRKYILLGFVVFISVTLLITHIKGEKQDMVFKDDYQKYQYSISSLREEQYTTSIEILQKLHQKYPNQANITRSLGLAYSLEGKNEISALYFQKAVEQRPFIVQEPLFSVRYGEVLYRLKEYDISKQYLEHSNKIESSKEYLQLIQSLLAEIQKYE